MGGQARTVGSNENTVKHMPTNAYVDIACFISPPFVRVPLAPIQRTETNPKILLFGGVTMLWLTLERKGSSFKLLIFIPVGKK